jgi:hypothetical protein
VTFFLEGNFKLNIFSLVISLFPGQLHFQIANHSISREKRWSSVAIFPSPVCREIQLCISDSDLSLQKIFFKHLDISLLATSHKLSLFPDRCYQQMALIMPQRKGRLTHTLVFAFHGYILHQVTPTLDFL